MTKVMSLTWNALMPRLSTSVLPPRSARIARPIAGIEQIVARGKVPRSPSPRSGIDLRVLDTARIPRSRSVGSRRCREAAEPVRLPNRIVDRESPGDRAQRQKMSAQPQRHEAGSPPLQGGQNQSKDKPEPRRITVRPSWPTQWRRPRCRRRPPARTTRCRRRRSAARARCAASE